MEFRYDDDKKKLIVSKSSKLEYNQCKLWLNRQVKGWKFMPAAKYGWKGYVDYFHDGQINLGLWKECFKACQEIGTSFNIENKQDFPLNRDVTLKGVTEFCNEFFKDHKVKNKEGEWIPFMPYDYQIETAYKILKNRYCLGQVATSGGKSLIVSIVFFYILENIDPDAKFLLVVPSITLVTQFYDNIVDYNLGENEGNKNPVDLRIEEIMSDKPRKHSGAKDPNLYIACFQSLAKKDKKTGESNWPDEFFKQFHTVAVDESHQSKSKSLIEILEKTFDSAYNRFGVSGTFPDEDSCEILTIQSVLGPIVTSIKAKSLIEKGKISPVNVKVITLNHQDYDFDDNLKTIRKGPDGGRLAYQLEKEYVQNSKQRLEFISKLVGKCKKNTLLLFNDIEYGTRLFESLKEEHQDKDLFYIDGSVKSKKRDEIKKDMEVTKKEVEYTILNFGDYELEFKSDTKIPLNEGGYKLASDITPGDDINDNFIKKIKEKNV